jgi:tRNA pseudouridine55 synthase
MARRSNRPPPAGVLVIDKPRGPTSHDVVARLRRALGVREIGHAGTLDPMATGVLVIAIGEATKLVPYLTAHRKAYEATVALGIETDTLDAEGRETKRAPLARAPDAHAIESALAMERARTSQTPPAFSAIRKSGERAHERARRGEDVELAPRPVAVHDLRLLEIVDDENKLPKLAIALEVSKGYYVRALARDLAERLGTVGHLTALRRTRSGPFTASEALPESTPPDELLARIIPLAHAAARALPTARLTASAVRDARHGRAVRAEEIEPRDEPGPHAWLDESGALVAIGEVIITADGSLSGRVLRGVAT